MLRAIKRLFAGESAAVTGHERIQVAVAALLHEARYRSPPARTSSDIRCRLRPTLPSVPFR